jgi:hypothetical protein
VGCGAEGVEAWMIGRGDAGAERAVFVLAKGYVREQFLF